MLTSNLDLENHFCNGAQGRALHWHPAKTEKGKAISASHPELLVRFGKEASLRKAEMLPDVDHIDLCPRAETLQTAPGQPVLLQIPLVPAYALTVHKTQALSIRHAVKGCLEGVFAYGQVYVLSSRVTDPENLHFVGIPPIDLLDRIWNAWRKAGHDPVECLRQCVKVTDDFAYEPNGKDLQDRFIQRFKHATTVPVKLRTLSEMLSPQPEMAQNMNRLLDWIDAADLASQRGESKPRFKTASGRAVFDDYETKWWLTNLQRKPQELALPPGDEDGPMEEESVVEDVDDITNASDTSDTESARDLSTENIVSHLGRPPIVCWEHRQSMYTEYFERQVGAHCGLHAINNAVGHNWLSIANMQEALRDYVCTRQREGLPELSTDHATPSGYYSSEVMCHAMQMASSRTAGVRGFEMSLAPLHCNPDVISAAVGAIVNIENRHWVALRQIGNQIWWLDSSDPSPHPLTMAVYRQRIQEHKDAFPIFGETGCL